MSSTVVGYFDNYDEAKLTEEDLIGSGFGQTDIQIMGERAPRAEEHRSKPGFWENLKDKLGFLSEEDQIHYDVAARHGAVLAVTAPDERVDLAAEIIERHHPSDLDRRLEEWGAESSAGAAETMQTEGNVTIPVVEEELRVGKQTIRRGGIRIHRFVTETPVEETVRLREEQVHVERHAVDRPVTAADEAFQERTIEVEEIAEEPVVAKEARVVEEIEVGKHVREEERTIADDLRRTEVEIERTPGKNRSS